MPELLRMPEVAAGAVSAVLSSWTIPENEDYAKGTVIAVIETDKAIVDYEAEADGRILRRLAPEGADIAIGEPIALVAARDEAVDDLDSALAALGGSAPSAAPPVSATSPATSPATSDAAPVLTAPTSPTGDASPTGDRLFVSPIARRMAREAGLDLTGLRGSGPNGRIRRRDVDAALAARAAGVPATPALTTLAPTPPTPSPTSAVVTDDVRVLPHSRLRRAIAARLTDSKRTAPHFYVRGTARVDRLMQLRAELNEGEETRVSVNDLIIKAVARAHMAVPQANVVWTDDALLMHSTVDISVAIATDSGLVTPVLRSVEQLSITQIATATKDFAARARSGQLRQHELEGGTTSVTNLGMYGTEDFAAIINPPQSSILAVGAARQEPVVDDGVLAVGTVMRVTLSVDHRPIDGAVAAEWMRTFLRLLENPAKILS